MAFQKGLLIALGYSGGRTVPELHRVPCTSAFLHETADHQRHN